MRRPRPRVVQEEGLDRPRRHVREVQTAVITQAVADHAPVGQPDFYGGTCCWALSACIPREVDVVTVEKRRTLSYEAGDRDAESVGWTRIALGLGSHLGG